MHLDFNSVIKFDDALGDIIGVALCCGRGFADKAVRGCWFGGRLKPRGGGVGGGGGGGGGAAAVVCFNGSCACVAAASPHIDDNRERLPSSARRDASSSCSECSFSGEMSCAAKRFSRFIARISGVATRRTCARSDRFFRTSAPSTFARHVTINLKRCFLFGWMKSRMDSDTGLSILRTY